MVGGYHFDGAGGFSGGAPEGSIIRNQNGICDEIAEGRAGFGGSYFSNGNGMSITEKEMLNIGGARWWNMWTFMGDSLL